MRRLERPEAPKILEQLAKHSTGWDALSPEDRAPIRKALDAMSERGNRTFCNYCEQLISHAEKGHIEHLASRSKHSKLIFDWHNLYLSCKEPEHCGEFKDSGKGVPYSPDQLVRPDQEDPEAIFRFFSTGKVQPRPGLDQQTRERAEETIEALNLNAKKLVNARSATAKQAEAVIFEILEDLETLSNEERSIFLEDEIRSFEGSPFLTTARQFFLEG